MAIRTVHIALLIEFDKRVSSWFPIFAVNKYYLQNNTYIISEINITFRIGPWHSNSRRSFDSDVSKF
jgi:hypothetical protein